MTKCDFTQQHYAECLDIAKQYGYEIIPVCEWALYSEFDRFILLRHDVDFFPQYALDIALIEHQKQIKSTFYFYLHSEFYNALSPMNMRIIKHISDLGHEIGYHVDTRYSVEGEEKILEKIIGKPIRSYAQHFYSSTPRKLIDNYLNAMSSDMGVKYISDSSRNWREGCMCKWINGKANKLEILTHPLWWRVKSIERYSTLDETFKDIKSELLSSMESFKDVQAKYIDDLNGIQKIVNNASKSKGDKRS